MYLPCRKNVYDLEEKRGNAIERWRNGPLSKSAQWRRVRYNYHRTYEGHDDADIKLDWVLRGENMQKKKASRPAAVMDIHNEYDYCEALRYYALRDDKNKKLFHYTSIGTVLNIVAGGYFWLNSFSGMNDPFEAEILSRNGMNGILFFTSFSKAEESLAMYEKYCGNNGFENGVALAVPCQAMKKIISITEFGENTDGVWGDGQYERNVRKFRIVEDGVLTDKKAVGDIYAARVAYFNPVSKILSFGSTSNHNFAAPFMDKELLGLVKYQCWDYEKEVRLFVCLEKQLGIKGKNIRIAVPLYNDLAAQCEVILNPRFERKAHQNELSILREHGLNIRDSIYDGCV